MTKLQREAGNTIGVIKYVSKVVQKGGGQSPFLGSVWGWDTSFEALYNFIDIL